MKSKYLFLEYVNFLTNRVKKNYFISFLLKKILGIKFIKTNAKKIRTIKNKNVERKNFCINYFGGHESLNALPFKN